MSETSNPMFKQLSASQIEDQEIHDRSEMVAKCMFCPDWQIVATAGEAREIAKSHRLEQHPDATQTTRAKRSAKQCKVGMCREPASHSHGRYGGLCETHKSLRREDELGRESARRGNENAATAKRVFV